jgi:mRNA-degrading endonuclease toxin of MazEF toxin-antitoxin module
MLVTYIGSHFRREADMPRQVAALPLSYRARQRQSVCRLSCLIPLTSQLDALRFPGTVLIEADAQNGLHRASVALVFQITAVDSRFIAEHLGSISTMVMQQLWSAFDTLTERSEGEGA